MKKLMYILLGGVLLCPTGWAQRTITIPVSGTVTVPANAQICADVIYANGPGYGTLNIYNSSCLCAGAIVTPVELLSFSASSVGDAVLLSWETVSETNNFGFEVQRRSGGAGDWVALGFVPGAGNVSEPRSYSFLDQDPFRNRAEWNREYRLKQIDLDGSSAYSPIVEVRLGADSDPLLFAPYPHPVRNRGTISFSIPDERSVRLAIYDAAGREVRVLKDGVRTGAGLHSMAVDAGSLFPGIYLLELVAGNARKTELFIVQQ